MNIELSSTILPLRAVFKLVAVGWTLGACVVIGIPLALFAVPSAFHMTAENEAVVWAGAVVPADCGWSGAGDRIPGLSRSSRVPLEAPDHGHREAIGTHHRRVAPRLSMP